MSFNELILSLYPPYTSVCSSYIRGDGRQHIVLNDSKKSKGEKGKTKTISYPKALMEVKLGRRLTDNETVDHINGDFTDNSIENLQVLDREAHVVKDVIRVKTNYLICPVCGVTFTPTKDQRKRPDRPHFCSRKCAGLYGKQVQLGQEKISPQEIKSEYYTQREN